VKGEIVAQQETLVRVHEPLSVTDFLEKKSPGHSTSVHEALQKMAEADAAVLVLLHRGETPQDLLSRATLDAGDQQHWDPRSYGIGAQILRDLKVGKDALAVDAAQDAEHGRFWIGSGRLRQSRIKLDKNKPQEITKRRCMQNLCESA